MDGTDILVRKKYILNKQLISTTNQKISGAKQHLKCLERLGDNTSKPLITAYHDSIVFQLYLASQSFVQEIAADYQVSVPKGAGFNELAALLDRNEIPCAQCTQLAELQENSESEDSWLSWLYSRYAKCWEMSDYSSSRSELGKDLLATSTLISISDISELSDQQRLKQCIDSLSVIIAEYRELMQQW